MDKAGAALGTAKEFKDVFEVAGVPAFNQFYFFGVFPWKYLYRGYYSAWHLVSAPTIENPNNQRKMFYLNLPKALCSELAGMVWTDQCDVSVSTEGLVPAEGQTDPLNDYVQSVLRYNNFNTKMGEAIEQAAALGGEALKVWFEQKHDGEGNVVDGKIRVGYCMADQFVPTAWDSAEVTEGIFISRQAKDGYYYTRLEWHKWDGDTYVITNDLYRADGKASVSKEPQDILGSWYPLNAIYPFLAEETPLTGIEKSLFSYFRTPTANNVDDNSPLGVSIYANAMETLHAIDICFDSFVREFQLGKKRIIVPARMIKTVIDPVSGQPRRYFDSTDETYEALNTDDPDSLKIVDNSVALRIDEHVAAMNAFLNIFCLQVGLSAGTFSFNANGGVKTATEVVSENSKTYKTVKCFQNQIKPAIVRMVENIIAVASLYDVEWHGVKVADLASPGFNVNVSLDDGITQDRQTNINEGVLLMGNGVLSKEAFLTDPKYGQALTPEAAKMMLQQVAAESTVSPGLIDTMMGANDDATNAPAEAPAEAGKLNGAQTQSLIMVIAQYQSGQLTIGQAIQILSASIGVTKDKAKSIILGKNDGDTK